MCGSLCSTYSQLWCENSNIMVLLQGGADMLMQILISDKTEKMKWLRREWESVQGVVTVMLSKRFDNG